MKKINLWTIDQEKPGPPSAHLVTDLDDSETEALLEESFVSSPDLLMDGLTLVGRQVSTAGGPLDLLGIDQDGQAVVFELKKGVLTRDAVAQVLDYGSDLSERGSDYLAQLIEKHSGQKGIDPIEDFVDWYDQSFPNNEDPLEDGLRMVLVGLGVDDRARRIVNFLASTGVDIQLLTFHAFEIEGRMLLARQVETEKPASRGDQRKTQSKENNERILLESAEQLRVRDLLEEAANFVEERMPAYRWPGKTAYSFSLHEKTSEGKPTLRSYVALYVRDKPPGTLLLQLSPRARDVAPHAVKEFAETVPAARLLTKSYACLEAQFTKSTWPEIREPLDELLEAIVEGWKTRTTEGEAERDTEE